MPENEAYLRFAFLGTKKPIHLNNFQTTVFEKDSLKTLYIEEHPLLYLLNSNEKTSIFSN